MSLNLEKRKAFGSQYNSSNLFCHDSVPNRFLGGIRQKLKYSGFQDGGGL